LTAEGGRTNGFKSVYHLDFDFGFVINEKGIPLYVGGENFINSRKKEISRIRKFLGKGKLHKITSSSSDNKILSMNFVVLPNGEIVMHYPKHETYDFLAKHYGENKIFGREINEIHPAYDIVGGAGRRCSSLIIY